MRGALAEDFLEQGAILEVHGNVNGARQVGGVEVQLFQQRGQKFGGLEFLEILPIKIAPVHHASSA